MEHAVRCFAERFEHWSIAIPAADVQARRAGHIQQLGWLIQYCFGTSERGEYLDYYATHRMAGDSHVRHYADGGHEELEALQSGMPWSPDPREAAEYERAHYERNRQIAEQLVAKGFDRFTLNMELQAGLDRDSDKQDTGA